MTDKIRVFRPRQIESVPAQQLSSEPTPQGALVDLSQRFMNRRSLSRSVPTPSELAEMEEAQWDMME